MIHRVSVVIYLTVLLAVSRQHLVGFVIRVYSGYYAFRNKLPRWTAIQVGSKILTLRHEQTFVEVVERAFTGWYCNYNPITRKGNPTWRRNSLIQ